MNSYGPEFARSSKPVLTFLVILVTALGVGFLFSMPAKPSSPPPDERKSPYPAKPPVAPAVSERASNYADGSCMHASLITLLDWQGRHKAADYWRANYWGGADVTDLSRIADRLQLAYAITTAGSVEFMQWASDTGRGAAIHWHRNTGRYWYRGRWYRGLHAVTFCGYFNGNAWLIDNNSIRNYIQVPKQEFIREWQSYGGYAMTVVYDRPAPKPWS